MPPFSLRPCLAKAQAAAQPQAHGLAGPPEHQPLSNELTAELMQVGWAGLGGADAGGLGWAGRS